eukprot:962010-Pleurochrysis_carterae.AAC.1
MSEALSEEQLRAQRQKESRRGSNDNRKVFTCERDVNYSPSLRPGALSYGARSRPAPRDIDQALLDKIDASLVLTKRRRAWRA